MTDPFPVFAAILTAGLATAILFAFGRWTKGGFRFPGLGLLGVAIAIWTVTFASLAILRHDSLHSHAYDLAIYDQVVWNTSQGRLFQNSIMHYLPHFLGDHFSLDLLAIAPLYWVWPDPRLLLVLQAIALGLLAIPVGLYARDRLGGGFAPLVFGLAVLLHPGLAFTAIFDFHDLAFAVPLIGVSLLLVRRGRLVPFVAVLLPILLIKEEMAIVVAAIGFWTALVQRKRRLGLSVAMIAMVWFALVVFVLIPLFNPDGQFYYLRRYFDSGEPGGGSTVTIQKIAGLIAGFASAPKLAYLGYLAVPFVLLPFGGSSLLAALPSLGYQLLSPEFPFDFITKHYSVLVLPFFAFAAIESAERIAGKWPRMAPSILAGTLVTAVASYFLLGPGPLARGFDSGRYTSDSRAPIIREAMALIPSDASVMAQSDLVAHLAHRQTVYMFPDSPSFGAVNYVLLDLQGSKYPLTNPEDDYDRALQQFILNPDYETILDKDDVLLLRRRPALEPRSRLDLTLGRMIGLDGYQLTSTEVKPSTTLTVTLWWRAIEKPVEDYVLFLHLLDKDGSIRSQVDVHPTEDWYPTSMWEPGRRFRVPYGIPVPSSLAAGNYRILLGIYGQFSGKRAPTNSSPSGDAILLPDVIMVR